MSSARPSSILTTATVSTGARLHFGLLTHRPESGREFGGLGVMIDSPGWTISASPAGSWPSDQPDTVHAAESVQQNCPEAVLRVTEIVDRFRCWKPEGVPPLSVRIESAIPSHRGLGSGTQLALATARAIDECLGFGPTPVAELASLTGRGLRSAVGTWGFESGGLIVDGGKQKASDVGALIARLTFPPDWRFVLLLPEDSAGLSGSAEVSAFASLQGMPRATTAELCRLALMELLPAVQEKDFDAAAESMGTYGRLSGEYFAPAQGGVFADPEMNQLGDSLAAGGWRGFLQTSWGPTCAVLCRDEAMAESVREFIASRSIATRYDLVTVRPCNIGADVAKTSPLSRPR